MELDEAERYAAAALYALALHPARRCGGTWAVADVAADPWAGVDDHGSTVRDARDAYDAPWAADLLASGGHVDAVLDALGTPLEKVPGIKALAAVNLDDDSLLNTVTSLALILDSRFRADLRESCDADEGSAKEVRQS
jgi:hypothetical protein